MHNFGKHNQSRDTQTITDLLRDVDALVDQKTAARIIGITNPKTLAVWRSNGSHPELPFRKVAGSCVRYRVGDLIRFRDGSLSRVDTPP